MATTTSAGYTNVGITTLVWGTDSLLNSPAPGNNFAGTGYYIVESVDEETDNEIIYIENGTGQKAGRVNIINGVRWVVSVQDDTSMTAPRVGTTVSMKDQANLLNGGSGTNYTARVVNSGERFSRKGAAMRNITVEKLTLID